MNMSEKLELIEQVLTFYASEENYRGPRYMKITKDNPLDQFSAVLIDRGQKARALINALHKDLDAHLDESSTTN